MLIFILPEMWWMTMDSKRSQKFLTISLTILMLSLSLEHTSYGQARTALATAVRRSQNAAKTIKIVAGMPEDEAIPMELFKRAYAIGVFPDVVKQGLLFSQGMKGYGVISSRQQEGWSLPAYYGYGTTQIKFNLPNFKSFDLIVLFMKKDAVDWFQGGRLEFKGLKAGVAGPVGKWTKALDLETSGISIFMYRLVDGKLQGLNVEADFMDGAVLNPDNNINKAVYGMKGREVLQGKAPNVTQASPEVTAFQAALNEKFPVTK
jgi:lipid-binding SYLF domain-containing protein